MDKRRLLSIIIPIFNGQEYLNRCLDSILAQTYRDIEIICVDDGSEDESGNICDHYASIDNRIRVIHGSNEGLTSARIKGIEDSKGEYIGFVDCDDWIESNMYQDLMSEIMLRDDVEIAIGSNVFDFIDHKEFFAQKGQIAEMDGIKAMEEMFRHRMFGWSVWDKIYKRELFFRLDIFDEYKKKKYGEDTFINSKLFSISKKVLYIPLFAYHYCINDKSMMRSSFSIEMLDYFYIWKGIIEEAKTTSHNEIAILVSEIMYSNGLNLLLKAEEKYYEYENEISKCIEVLKEYGRPPSSVKSSHKYNYVTRSLDRIIEDDKRINSDLHAFFVNHKRVYLYGAGLIANEAIDRLDKLGLNVFAIVLTQKSGTETFHDKKIFETDDLLNEYKDEGFILALGEKNYKEVMNTLQGIVDNNDIYNYGRNSYNYA